MTATDRAEERRALEELRVASIMRADAPLARTSEYRDRLGGAILWVGLQVISRDLRDVIRETVTEGLRLS